MFLEPGRIKIIKGCCLNAKFKVFHCAHFDIIASSPFPIITDIKSAHDNPKFNVIQYSYARSVLLKPTSK